MTLSIKRWSLWILLLGLVVVSLLVLLWPRAAAVDFVVIDSGHLLVTVEDDGETRLREPFVVSAPVTGHMNRIDIEVGDIVRTRRTVIARIDPIAPNLLDVRSLGQALAAVEAAEAAETLAAAHQIETEAELEFAAAELDRARRLRADNIIPQRELESANRAFRVADAALATAVAARQVSRSDLERARARLRAPGEFPLDATESEHVDVRSPIDGTVVRVFRESAGVVNAGEPLVEVGDVRELEIVADLLSIDAVRVRTGQRVLIDAWGGERPLEGVVRRVSPFARTEVSALGIEEQRVDVTIDFVDPPRAPEGLGHGFHLDVHIVLDQADDVLTVPLTALVRSGDNWSLFVEEGGRAAQRPVTVGRRNGLIAEVVDGLDSGERVLAYPDDTIEPGTRVIGRES